MLHDEPLRDNRMPDPSILVIFGATGDLMSRKLTPAVYHLGRDGLLPHQFACIGCARKEKSDEQFRQEWQDDINTFARTKPIDETFWNTFQEKMHYCRVLFDEQRGYDTLRDMLKQIEEQFGAPTNYIFYLSVQPKYFPIIVEHLHKAELLTSPSSRVVIEKPFGEDQASASELQAHLEKYLAESQIYRIDHYLGKETVQNLLVFRFANAIFESLWNYKYIDHVQITVAEEIGIGSRGAFFEEAGLLRDIVQNHMMQLLSLIAMEPPVDLSSSAIHDEKVKVLQAIRPWTNEDFIHNAVRGQYGPGVIEGESVKGYREEDEVNPESRTETYVALRLFIDNWRWAGAPFYLRGGKRLPKRATEIAIFFKDAPGVLFPQQQLTNVLVIRIQPDEGISMKINCKVPGLNISIPIQPVKMDFRYNTYFGKTSPEAYERLLWDCFVGDRTLFARADEVAQSWHILTPLLNYWANTLPPEFPNYTSGTWGPEEANALIARDGRTWRML